MAIRSASLHRPTAHIGLSFGRLAGGCTSGHLLSGTSQMAISGLVFGLAAFAPDLAHFKVKPLYLYGVVAGGLIFGVGMSLAGHCPGTAMIGLGSGIGEGLLAVAGGLVGATAFIFAFPVLKPIFFDPADFGKLTIPGVLGLPALPTALFFGARRGARPPRGWRGGSDLDPPSNRSVSRAGT